MTSYQSSNQDATAPVSFSEHFASSELFDAIFKRGMALVERTACYLEGPGRKDHKKLSPGVQLAYASESMRLTTRLLELASWLLIRRGLNAGEITLDEARQKRRRLKLPASSIAHIKHFDELPKGLRELIEESVTLTDRITRLDRGLAETPLAAANVVANPVAGQMAQLRAAFGG